jgi:hypothetical protein
VKNHTFFEGMGQGYLGTAPSVGGIQVHVYTVNGMKLYFALFAPLRLKKFNREVRKERKERDNFCLFGGR